MDQSLLGIEEIFQAAILIDKPAELKAYLDRACNGDVQLRARLERLLTAHAIGADGLLESPPSGLGAEEVAEIPATMAHTTEQLGGQIGPYKLLQKLGEGGMGTVYMAEQKKPVARRVALKIIKPGMDSGQVIARFEAERQALAMMDHPNIAKVFDAGATSLGRPYFVMELVKGIPITQYCDENHLSTKQRLGLFVEVCHAVQHAHQKGIIHRDLKPQNVLVADYDHKPVPKVIDFGIAKAITQSLTEKTIFTEIGQIVGTIEYMSPEQAKLNQLDVDTRTDVYSLGVLLYQLLTGVTPIESKRLRSAGFEEMLRIIREEEPPKPSTRISSWGASAKSLSDSRRTSLHSLKKMVQGDLDWIVMKAIEKDRARRYDTANAFADDVQRYLSDELVSARPPSAMYRTSKFLRRNKGTLAVAGAVILLVGLSAMGFRFQSEQAKNMAEQAKNMAETRSKQENIENNAMLDVNRVLDASQDDIQRSIDGLPSNLYGAKSKLEEVAVRTPRNMEDKHTLNAQLAIVKGGDVRFLQQLVESLLTESAGYAKVIRDVLGKNKGLGLIEENLWRELRSNTQDETGIKRRFRAGLALAAYAPDSSKWNDEQHALMATQILAERPVDQAIYLSQIKPIAKFCIPTWKEIFKGNDVFLQGSAAYALEYFAGGELLTQKDIAELLAVANPKQFQILFPLIKRPADSSFIAQLRSLAATPPPEDTETEDRVEFGQARAGAGITLLRLGDHQAGLDMFRMESDLENQKRAVDPEALAQFVHRSRDRGVTAEVVADCLKSLDSHGTLVTTSKDAARYALLLALSEYPVEDVAPKLLEKLVSQAGDWYRNDPRSSVHGAARWLLYKWDRIDVVNKVDHTSIPYSPSREWFTRAFRAKDGQATYMTFIVFRSGEFTIGSPNDEEMRDKREARHRVRITRPYALADREVTKEEITAFSEQEGIPVKQFPGAPEFAGPGLTWYEAVRFCRWLTKQDGMTEGSQPYPAADSLEVKDLPKVPGFALSTPRDWPLHVERTGYRLPTEQEWEVAARSGVLTRYFYGGDRDLLLDYAWLGANSKREPHEPKTRMPNLRGMFDMHGNMFEWCHDWIGDYLTDEVLDDWTGQEYGDRRVLRGGCWGITHQFCRNSLRMSHDPTTPFPFIGFRVAMTLPNDKEFAREALSKNATDNLSTISPSLSLP